MKKIGFVTPWFGMDIPGGAEMELRELVLHLKNTELQFEILTTCAKSFNSDWNQNIYEGGEYIENGIKVKRFPVDKRDVTAFDRVNAKLMRREKIAREEEETFAREMINSSELYRYMKEYDEEYDLFVFIPYMFGTTYNGVKVNPKKSVLIPCFHDESYFHMSIFRENFSKVAGIVYNAKPEQELTKKHYDVENIDQIVMGIGMETDICGKAERFRKKYAITEPFILYAGRKDKGKNVDTLIQYYAEYGKRNKTDLQLVLIGGGDIGIPENIRDRVHDLGFVDVQDKYDACAAAAFLCQPSHNESFSLVIMESWLCGTPVLVSDACKVTKSFVREANGGLYFRDYYEFEYCTRYFLSEKEKACVLGKQGRAYVLSMFNWDAIIERYISFFETVVEKWKDKERGKYT